MYTTRRRNPATQAASGLAHTASLCLALTAINPPAAPAATDPRAAFASSSPPATLATSSPPAARARTLATSPAPADQTPLTAAPPAAPPARLATADTTAIADPTPLLTFAASQHFPPVFVPETQASLQKQINRITFDLSKDPPPALNCSQTLGAKRFATLYDDLAQAYSNRGEHVKAVDAYGRAIDCNPRADFLHAELAASLMDLGRYADARSETQRQLRLGRANFTLYTLVTQLDFIEERWADAISNARLAATAAPTDEQAAYWQCFLWLAQQRAGTRDPVLVKRSSGEFWPQPILEFLQAQITEADLVTAVKQEEDKSRQRDILSEALFYTGQQRLAAKRTAEAVRYFTATVNLQVVYFIEHQLAMAELNKLRHPVPVPVP